MCREGRLLALLVGSDALRLDLFLVCAPPLAVLTHARLHHLARRLRVGHRRPEGEEKIAHRLGRLEGGRPLYEAEGGERGDEGVGVVLAERVQEEAEAATLSTQSAAALREAEEERVRDALARAKTVSRAHKIFQTYDAISPKSERAHPTLAAFTNL